MRAGAPQRLAARRVGALICAAVLLGMPGIAGVWQAAQAASPPIVIPPATQIAPPVIPPPPTASPPTAPTPSPAAASGIEPAPRALLPTHVQVLRDSRGSGLAMYGALAGKADSASAVTLAIFANSEAFDPIPAVQLMVADEDDRQAQALFTATVRGVPVIGVAVAALSPAGGDVTVLYDNADGFALSFPRMQQALKDDGGLQTVMLSPIHLDDGGTIGLPPGWRVMTQGADSVDLQGPQGEFVSLGDALPVYTGDTTTGG